MTRKREPVTFSVGTLTRPGGLPMETWGRHPAVAAAWGRLLRADEAERERRAGETEAGSVESKPARKEEKAS